MSKLKDAIKVYIDALDKLAPIAQDVVDEFMTRWGVEIKNSQDVRFVDFAPQGAGNYNERMTIIRWALETCEENEERILKLEARGSSRVQAAIDRLEYNTELVNRGRRAVPGMLARADEMADAKEFMCAFLSKTS